jgi:Chromo (CHRromatin Organisation MOdifier) domain
MVFLDRRFIKTQRPSIKLDWKKLGPFKIIKKINDVAYQLQLPYSMRQLHSVFHVLLLHPAKSTFPRSVQSQPPPVILDCEHEFFEVEDILDGKRKNGKWKFLVLWKGYSASDNSWEPEENILNCEHLIQDFKNRYASKSAARGASVRN